MAIPLHIQGFSHAQFTHPSISELPSSMSHEECQKFAESVAAVTPDDKRDAVLYWEHALLPEHPDSPFILVRVADVHATLGSPATALMLYEKAQQIIGHGSDPVFDAFILTHEARTNELTASRGTSSGFVHAIISYTHEMGFKGHLSAETRYWQPFKQSKDYVKPVAAPTLPEVAPSVLETWKSMSHQSGDVDSFFNFFCIETNYIENTFRLTEKSTRELVHFGFSPEMVDYKQKSEIKDQVAITDILEDTYEAYKMISGMIGDLSLLTPQRIKDVHRVLMRHSTVLVIHGADRSTLKYTNAGETRTVTKKNVLINTELYKIAFCPHEMVDKELEWICNQARQWIRTFRNPFAVAAWLHLVFVRCHPFDDGNGRMARLIASIPLVRAGYPPICISLAMQANYYESLNAAYDGQLAILATCFARSLESTFQEITSM